MPVIKSAIKKLRQDRKKEHMNDEWRRKVRDAVRDVRKSATPKTLQEAFTTIDKAAKNNIFHANKAARMKSRLSKLVKADKAPARPKKAATKTSSSKPSQKTA